MKKPATPQEQAERFRRALQVVPVKNAHVRVQPLEEDPDQLEVVVHLTYDNPFLKFFRYLFGARSTKTYVLDRIGTRVYRAIDGKKTFEQLCDEFAAREKLTFFEARALLGQYLQMLTQKGLVVGKA